MLRYAVVTTGAILVILLTFIAALVSRQVVTPVRAARRAAESLASGNLHDRMQVRGQDDLARLATSMNYMASELEKQITTLEELSAVQQRFVSDVSHELRTPLTTVRMAAEVLYEAREDFDPVAARSAELLQTELDRFEALLTDLLEISRFDAGAAVLTSERSTCATSCTRVVEANAPLAETHGTPRSTCTPAGEAKAEVDARRIERILRNLLVNAIEHSEGRPIDIFDRERRRRGGGGGARPRRRLRGEPGQAGVPPVLAGRPGAGPYRRRHRPWPGDRDGGRQPARRLADGVGTARPGRPVPADPAAAAGAILRDLTAAAGAAGPGSGHRKRASGRRRHRHRALPATSEHRPRGRRLSATAPTAADPTAVIR